MTLCGQCEHGTYGHAVGELVFSDTGVPRAKVVAGPFFYASNCEKAMREHKDARVVMDRDDQGDPVYYVVVPTTTPEMLEFYGKT